MRALVRPMSRFQRLAVAHNFLKGMAPRRKSGSNIHLLQPGKKFITFTGLLI